MINKILVFINDHKYLYRFFIRFRWYRNLIYIRAQKVLDRWNRGNYNV